MMNVEYYTDKASDIVWGNIDTNKPINDDKLENINSVIEIVAELSEKLLKGVL